MLHVLWTPKIMLFSLTLILCLSPIQELSVNIINTLHVTSSLEDVDVGYHLQKNVVMAAILNFTTSANYSLALWSTAAAINLVYIGFGGLWFQWNQFFSSGTENNVTVPSHHRILWFSEITPWLSEQASKPWYHLFSDNTQQPSWIPWFSELTIGLTFIYVFEVCD